MIFLKSLFPQNKEDLLRVSARNMAIEFDNPYPSFPFFPLIDITNANNSYASVPLAEMNFFLQDVSLYANERVITIDDKKLILGTPCLKHAKN